MQGDGIHPAGLQQATLQALWSLSESWGPLGARDARACALEAEAHALHSALLKQKLPAAVAAADIKQVNCSVASGVLWMVANHHTTLCPVFHHANFVLRSAAGEISVTSHCICATARGGLMLTSCADPRQPATDSVPNGQLSTAAWPHPGAADPPPAAHAHAQQRWHVQSAGTRCRLDASRPGRCLPPDCHCSRGSCSDSPASSAQGQQDCEQQPGLQQQQ